MASTAYATNIFINYPFDDAYLELRNALVFAIFDCGFVPRCALEEDNSGNIRFEKIKNLIAKSKFAIHDISRTELDLNTNLPRFNMPLELGVFFGAKRYGNNQQQLKNCLILDIDQYRYQSFISDIAGHDIRAHNNNPENIIIHVRNWLNTASSRRTIPGGSVIVRRYRNFLNDLPNICAEIPIEINELTYNDYTNFISNRLFENTN